MKAVELLEKLRSLPVFTLGDLSRIVRKDERYVKVMAYRLGKRGLIRRVERGTYTVHTDPVEIASYLATPSYISFWTALRLYGLTEQLPRGIMVAVSKPKKRLAFQGERIEFTKVKHFWGYGKTRYRDFDIFLAEKEKAVIDCLLLKNTPFDEAAKAVLSGELDYGKLAAYAGKTANKALAKRIGFLVEKAGREAGMLLDMVDRNYIPLDWNLKRGGKKDFRWRLIVNTAGGQA
ncbi:MAG: hypothetical protein HY520_02655 [Candidatus Aenigmarchaeota archaeon]|nr:hypothetical protein [Candidatus Aenigmarchaeota archaeon]